MNYSEVEFQDSRSITICVCTTTTFTTESKLRLFVAEKKFPTDFSQITVRKFWSRSPDVNDSSCVAVITMSPVVVSVVTSDFWEASYGENCFLQLQINKQHLNNSFCSILVDQQPVTFGILSLKKQRIATWEFLQESLQKSLLNHVMFAERLGLNKRSLLGQLLSTVIMKFFLPYRHLQLVSQRLIHFRWESLVAVAVHCLLEARLFVLSQRSPYILQRRLGCNCTKYF